MSSNQQPYSPPPKSPFLHHPKPQYQPPLPTNNHPLNIYPYSNGELHTTLLFCTHLQKTDAPTSLRLDLSFPPNLPQSSYVLSIYDPMPNANGHVMGDLLYERANVVVFCFAMCENPEVHKNNPNIIDKTKPYNELHNIINFHLPRLKRTNPLATYLLVGVQTKAEQDPSVVQQFIAQGYHITTPAEGRAAAEKMTKTQFLQCVVDDDMSRGMMIRAAVAKIPRAQASTNTSSSSNYSSSWEPTPSTDHRDEKKKCTIL